MKKAKKKADFGHRPKKFSDFDSPKMLEEGPYSGIAFGCGFAVHLYTPQKKGMSMSKFRRERRDVLKSAGTLIATTAIGVAGGNMPVFAAGGPMPIQNSKGVPLKNDTFIFADGPNKGTGVLVTDIAVDAPPVTVKAVDPATGKVREDDGDTDHATVLLYRVDPAKITLEDVKNDTVEGILGFTAVCPHQACILTGWDAASKQFLCPCHQALFDPLKGGQNTGGARTRMLAQIPLTAVEGRLVVANQVVEWIGIKRG
jgi:rieske iron-sulfur protein